MLIGRCTGTGDGQWYTTMMENGSKGPRLCNVAYMR